MGKIEIRPPLIFTADTYDQDDLKSPTSPNRLLLPSEAKAQKEKVYSTLLQWNQAKENRELIDIIKELHRTFFDVLQHEEIFSKTEKYQINDHIDISQALKLIDECTTFQAALFSSPKKEKYKDVFPQWERFASIKLRKFTTAVKSLSSMIETLKKISGI